MKSLKVKVTKAHIAKGIKNHCSRCPVARAVRDVTHKFTEVSNFIQVHNGSSAGMYSNSTTYSMPQKARNFILAFDGGKPVKPFSFVARRA